MKNENFARITLWVNRLIAASLCALLFLMPRILRWYQGVRPLGDAATAAIFFGFYLCAPVVFLALWSMERLLRNILAGDVFVWDNVVRIRRIRWCCAGVSLICLPAAFFYQPLLFMVVIMAFLALVVSVLENVMASAVELREENDLTV